MKLIYLKTLVLTLILSLLLSSCTVVAPVVNYNIHKSEFREDSTDTQEQVEEKKAKEAEVISNGLFLGGLIDVSVLIVTFILIVNAISGVGNSLDGMNCDDEVGNEC